jgi:hypothetical protein
VHVGLLSWRPVRPCYSQLWLRLLFPHCAELAIGSVSYFTHCHLVNLQGQVPCACSLVGAPCLECNRVCCGVWCGRFELHFWMSLCQWCSRVATCLHRSQVHDPCIIAVTTALDLPIKIQVQRLRARKGTDGVCGVRHVLEMPPVCMVSTSFQWWTSHGRQCSATTPLHGMCL